VCPPVCFPRAPVGASRHCPRSTAVSRERDQPQRLLPDEKTGIDPESRNDSTAAADAPRTQPRSGQSVIGGSIEMRPSGGGFNKRWGKTPVLNKTTHPPFSGICHLSFGARFTSSSTACPPFPTAWPRHRCRRP
jgi:hypothetical protein